MEKKDVQNLLRDKMQGQGFDSRRNYHYKMIEEDYLVGVWLDHHPYCKGYFIEYGALFLPDEEKMPFKGFCDWSMRFEFTKQYSDDLEKYPLQDISNKCTHLIDYFEYGVREWEELSISIDKNIEKRLFPIYDKKNILNDYRKNVYRLLRLPQKTVEKILKYGGFDMEQIEYEKRKKGIKW